MNAKTQKFKNLCLLKLAVTYADHYVGSSPGWEIDPDWLQRVSDVVDAAVEAGLYVLTNVHHGMRLAIKLPLQFSAN